jgi:hypothetical protein
VRPPFLVDCPPWRDYAGSAKMCRNCAAPGRDCQGL